MIKYYIRSVKHKKIKEISKFRVGCWINVIDPTPAELKFLVDRFKLDKVNLHSGVDQHEVPRMEFVKKDIYILCKNITENFKLFTYLPEPF